MTENKPKLLNSVIKFMNNKQLTIKKRHRLGSLEEQLLLFSLVHLILCYLKKISYGLEKIRKRNL